MEKKTRDGIVALIVIGIILFFWLVSWSDKKDVPYVEQAPKMNIEDSSKLRSWTPAKREEVANMARWRSRADQREIAKEYNISLYELDILLK